MKSFKHNLGDAVKLKLSDEPGEGRSRFESLTAEDRHLLIYKSTQHPLGSILPKETAMQNTSNNKAAPDTRRKTEDARRRPTNYGPSSSYTPATDVHHVHHVHHSYHDSAPSCDSGDSGGGGGDSSGGCGGGE